VHVRGFVQRVFVVVFELDALLERAGLLLRIRVVRHDGTDRADGSGAGPWRIPRRLWRRLRRAHDDELYRSVR
jgi:hypothetical protein